jgi:RAB protein geranylgeranyltransferase component A
MKPNLRVTVDLEICDSQATRDNYGVDEATAERVDNYIHSIIDAGDPSDYVYSGHGRSEVDRMSTEMGQRSTFYLLGCQAALQKG